MGDAAEVAGAAAGAEPGARESAKRGAQLNFRAIAGATLVAMGVWLLLHLLGLAAGFIVPDRGDPESLRGVGFGSSTFAVLAPLVALFVGGVVVVHMGDLGDRRTSALHGAMVWALTAVFGLFSLSLAVSALVGHARPVRGAIAVARGADPAGALGLDLGAIVAPTNARRAQSGAAPVTVPQVQAVAADLVPRRSEARRLDRVVLVEKLRAATGLPAAEAEQIAGRIEREVTQRHATSGFGRRGLWGSFFVILLGLVSAAAGASVASARRKPPVTAARAAELPTATPAPARS
jgi:hypothetical protein